jgi:hypothetical protein
VKLRWPTAAAVLLAVAGLATAGAAARPMAVSVHSRIVFGTWDPNGPPERINYCGRRYYAGGDGTRTREEAMAGPDPASHSSWREIGHTDGGTPYYAMVLPDATRSELSPAITCTMMVYLRVRTDAYRVYTLSGGP